MNSIRKTLQKSKYVDPIGVTITVDHSKSINMMALVQTAFPPGRGQYHP
jgi:hypothetical protein